jgi:hypothetical protein
MTLLTRTTEIELQVLSAILLVLILNALVFVAIDINQQNTYHNILGSFAYAGIIYVGFIVFNTVVIACNQRRLAWLSFLALLALMTVHIVLNLYYLLIDKRISDNGVAILSDAFLIWIASLLVFSLWYWVIDRGGPVKRETDDKQSRYDLLFPQYQSKIPGWDNWKPKYTDYIFFSFFTSTGFSPADTLPLTKRVKFLMMTEATISLIIIGMVASRAMSLVQ